VPRHSGLLYEEVGIHAIIIDFSKAFDLVPHDRLLTKLAISGVDTRVVVWVRELLVGRTQKVTVGRHLSKEVKINSGVPQGSVLRPLLFLVYVSDIWRNVDSNIRIFADEFIIYKKITNKNDIENLQKDLDTLVEWAVVNGVKINPRKIRQ